MLPQTTPWLQIFAVLWMFFLLGDSLLSECYVQTFRSTQGIPKSRYIKSRRRGINQKKEHNEQKSTLV
jgi:hypothetical protein